MDAATAIGVWKPRALVVRVMTPAYTPATSPVTNAVPQGATYDAVDVVEPKLQNRDAHADGSAATPIASTTFTTNSTAWLAE